ncbi:MAG: hypothetical protein RRY64_03425, partial [Oscillospiraceae bacterium]
MGDLEHNQYDEYGPCPPEQAPLPGEVQESCEYRTTEENHTFVDHRAPAAARQKNPNGGPGENPNPKPKPPVSHMAMQFVAISTAAAVTVTAGAALSGGTFLPELGAWATETVQQIAAVQP